MLLRRGRRGGARADLVAAGHRTVLLRHRPRRPGELIAARAARSTRCASHRRRLARLPVARGPRGGDDRPRRAPALPRLPDAATTRRDPGGPPAREAPLRARAGVIEDAGNIHDDVPDWGGGVGARRLVRAASEALGASLWEC